MYIFHISTLTHYSHSEASHTVHTHTEKLSARKMLHQFDAFGDMQTRIKVIKLPPAVAQKLHQTRHVVVASPTTTITTAKIHIYTYVEWCICIESRAPSSANANL